MTATDLLAHLDRLGVRLAAEDDRLRVGGVRDLLTPGLLERIKQNKAELLRLLQPGDRDHFAPFPLTDIQQAYFAGRGEGRALGGVSCHTYHEFESGDLDLDRLERSWQRVVECHDMLRAVVLPDATQQVLERVPAYRIARTDLRGLSTAEALDRLASIRRRLSHEVRPAAEWPLFNIQATLLDGGRTILHFGFDLLIGDAASMLTIFAEWRRLYETPDAMPYRPGYTFRQYVLAERASERTAAFERAKAYWLDRVANMPPGPEIPLAQAPAAGAAPIFTRRYGRLEAGPWSVLKDRARESGVTPSALLCAAYADALGAWSATRDFTVNLTTFRRPPLHPDIGRVVGDFTSTLFLEVDRAAASFRERAASLQSRLAADLDHMEYSGVRVAREIARRGEAANGIYGAYVFTSLLGHAAEPGGALAWLGEVIDSVSQTPQVLIDHQAREEDGALVFTWDHPVDMFPGGVPEAMFGAYCSLLERLAKDAALWDAPSLSLLPSEQSARRAEANATNAPVSTERLETLFAAQAARQPESPAIITPDLVLSYGEVHARATAMAARLRAAGVSPGDLVAIVLPKGAEQVVAALAILAAGAAYLPLDHAAPPDRVRSIIEASGARLSIFASGWQPGARPCATGRESLAYVIYTSGSTGTPKGVMIDHEGAVNTILDVNRRFGINPADRVLGISALSFDLSVFDIFGTLAAGAALVLPDGTKGRDPAQWADLIARHRVSVWNSVPILASLLADHLETSRQQSAATLRLVMLSGDWIPLPLPDRLRSLSPGATIVSLGGATEASIWSILYPIGAIDPEWKSIPYGRPMANQRFHVLNERLEPCADWVPGGLYIGGIGVAAGYLGDPERTAASFLRHPGTGERVYRTGDLGRWLPDGNIEFLGRRDNQVKVNGYRIELGEIEAALLRYPGIAAAAASVAGERGGPKRILAHVVAATSVRDDDIRRFLRTTLPDYMIPAAFTRLPALPLSANGKLDRKALLADTPAAAPPPRAGGIRAKVQARASEVLGMDVAPEDNLIHSGANSVDMIRLVTLLEGEFGFRPEMTEFFRMQTVDRIAAWYERQLYGSADAAPACEPVWSDPPIIAGAREREEFKRQAHGRRRPEPDWLRIPLPAVQSDGLLSQYTARRSHRSFSGEAVPLCRLAALLSVLARRDEGRLYGSAGSAYPVQLHLYAKPGGIEGLTGGTYYYAPEMHELFQLDAGARLTSDMHLFDNRQIFDDSVFSLFLIAKAGAIAPLYGPQARDFALIEAGLQTQLLEMAAPACEIGLCQIGAIDFEPARGAFRLDPDHVLLHSLVGGAIGWEEGSL